MAPNVNKCKESVASVPLVAACVLLVAAVAIVFGQTVQYPFLDFDDNTYVFDNAQVLAGLTLRGVWYAFTSGPGGEWYPLAVLSHMADVQVYGLNAGGHHLTNVLLHGAATVFLLLALVRMTGDLRPSVLVAGLFAIHPLHVESVAWIAERRDVLSGLFFMLALWAYAGYVRQRSLVRFLSVVCLFLLGLLAKPMLVTFPFLLLLLDVWPLRRFDGVDRAAWWPIVREKIPMLALALVVVVITLATHQVSDPSRDPVAGLSLTARVSNAVVAYAVSLRQFVYPAALSPFYPHPGDGLSAWTVALAVLALVGVTVVAVLRRRQQPYLLIGWLWYAGMLVPVSGIVQVGVHAMADRYSYLSHIGLYMALAWALAGVSLAGRAVPSRRIRDAVGVGVLALLMVVAWRQTSYWRDGETLWAHASEVTPEHPYTNFHLGLALEAKGDTAGALARYRRALELDPLYVQARNALGIRLAMDGRSAEAVVELERALQGAPSSPETLNNLANTLARLGRTDEAIARFEQVVRLAPDLTMARYNLGQNLVLRGRLGEASAHFRHAIAIDPRFAGAHLALADIDARVGNVDAAIEHYERALEVEPDLAAAHFGLGLAVYKRGRVEEAVRHWIESVRLEPGGVMALAGVAWQKATSPNPDERDGAEAVMLAELANDIAGMREPALLDVLAAAYAETWQFTKAEAAAERAITLAQERNDSAQVAALRQRLALYRAREPFHTDASAPRQ
jgi:tetratricopeptide (TPR) repeat protein